MTNPEVTWLADNNVENPDGGETDSMLVHESVVHMVVII